MIICRVSRHIKRFERTWMVDDDYVFVLDVWPIWRNPARPGESEIACLDHRNSFGNRSRTMHQNQQTAGDPRKKPVALPFRQKAWPGEYAGDETGNQSKSEGQTLTVPASSTNTADVLFDATTRSAAFNGNTIARWAWTANNAWCTRNPCRQR